MRQKAERPASARHPDHSSQSQVLCENSEHGAEHGSDASTDLKDGGCTSRRRDGRCRGTADSASFGGCCRHPGGRDHGSVGAGWVWGRSAGGDGRRDVSRWGGRGRCNWTSGSVSNGASRSRCNRTSSSRWTHDSGRGRLIHWSRWLHSGCLDRGVNWRGWSLRAVRCWGWRRRSLRAVRRWGWRRRNLSATGRGVRGRGRGRGRGRNAGGSLWSRSVGCWGSRGLTCC